MRRFEVDNTIQFKARFYNFPGELSDSAELPKLTVYNSRGAVSVNDQDMSRDDTGIYHYYWTPDTSDKYLLKISGTVAGHVSLIRKAFKVEKTAVD